MKKKEDFKAAQFFLLGNQEHAQSKFWDFEGFKALFN
jgi:hypothetical protein